MKLENFPKLNSIFILFSRLIYEISIEYKESIFIKLILDVDKQRLSGDFNYNTRKLNNPCKYVSNYICYRHKIYVCIHKYRRIK